MVQCKVCNQVIKNNIALSRHIKLHKLSSNEYYDMYLKHEDEGFCKICNAPTKLYSLTYGYRPYCSIKCKNLDKDLQDKISNTNFKLYGGRGFKSQELNEKGKTTCEILYGDRNYNNEEQRKQTNLQTYGVENVLCKESNQRLIAEQTKLERYGNKNFTNTEKSNQTKILKYNKSGYNNYEKTKQTNLIKYNTEHVFLVDKVKQKIKNTIKERYGVEWPMQNPDIKIKAAETFLNNIDNHKLKINTYYYNNLKFDSKPELEYYIWLTDNKIDFIYHPDIKLEYYVKEEKHYYLPDFLINNNELHEIKGLHFFRNQDPTDIMICPFDETRNERYECKYKCMIQHNVKIITDFELYESHINTVYGKDYLTQFKVK